MAHYVTHSDNSTLILVELDKLDKMAGNIIDSSLIIYNAFGVIEILCYFNLMFFITQII